MPLWKIALRSIQFRSVSSLLTAFSMSLGAALVVTVIVIHGVLNDSFNKSAQGYDLIIAGKGSPLDVVLSSAFYLRNPVGGVPDRYLKILRGQENLVIGETSENIGDVIEEAIPITIGHHYKGMPIIGTVPDYFTKLKYRGGQAYRFAEGENIKYGDQFSAVIGSRASKRTGLRLGSPFSPESAQEAATMHHEPFTIVGVLEPTGTPNDGAVFVHIDGFFDMHENHEGTPHEDDPHEGGSDKNHVEKNHAQEDNAPEDHKAERHYSAILVMTKQDVVSLPKAAADPNDPNFNAAQMLNTRAYASRKALELPRLLEKTTDVQAVSPLKEISTLLTSVIGNIQIILLLLATLVILVAGIGMMVSIYNSMSERRTEIALMRALGARRLTVMAIILLESILLSLGGGMLGLLFGHLLIAGISPLISEHTGIVIRFWDFQLAEIILIPGLILLASVVGFLPAAVAYKQDVAASLAP